MHPEVAALGGVGLYIAAIDAHAWRAQESLGVGVLVGGDLHEFDLVRRACLVEQRA